MRRLMRDIAGRNAAMEQVKSLTSLTPPLGSEAVSRMQRQFSEATAGREFMAGIATYEQLQRLARGVGVDHDRVAAITGAVRVPDDQWRGIIDASRVSSANLNSAITGAGISGEQWQRIIDASSASALIQSSSIPREQLRAILDGIAGVAREHDADEVAEAADNLAAEVETAEPIADPEGTNVSWLVNLPLLGQLAAVYAAMDVLDALGQWAAVTFTGEELPPEVTTAAQVVFAMAALLLTLADLRGNPPDDDQRPGV